MRLEAVWFFQIGLSGGYLEACRNIDGIEYLLDCMDKYPEETVQAMEDNGLTRWLAQRLDKSDAGRDAA